jgi:hypothetical protein
MVMRNVTWVSQGSGTDICWAACAQMWATAEGLAYWTRDQYVDFAGQGLAYNPGAGGGQGLDSLGDFIRNSVGALYNAGYMPSITTVIATQRNDVPDITSIINNMGTVYAAFSWPGGTSGHVNVVFGADDAGIHYCADPLDSVVQRQIDYGWWYTALPAFFAYKTPPLTS